MSELAISALTRKRAELAGELEELERRSVQLRADLIHLDAALVILDPATAAAQSRLRIQQRPEWFGSLGVLVLDVLRGATEPMTSIQVAVEVMGLRGLDASDRTTLRVVERRVAGALNRRIGLVERVSLGSRWVGWRVTG
jgi:hypothetical protein